MSDHGNTAPLILFVDDEAIAVKYFQRAMDALATVVTAGSVEEGQRLLDKHAGTLLVLVSDQRMPGGYGNELLHYARLNYPHMVRILTTAYSELEQTIEAVNQGRIHRYLHKPWEISALRLEMKQALELAALHKEHAELLREKLIVRQAQTVSGRIGALYALCASLASPDFPLDVYLSAAATIGIRPPEPDWVVLDYAQLVSAEAHRSGRFGHDLNRRLGEIRSQHADSDGLALLAEMLGDKVKIVDDKTAVFSDGHVLAEFLETSNQTPVSPQHASWLAFLIRLHEQGYSLQLTSQTSGLHCRLEKTAPPAGPDRLAEWVERFCNMPLAGPEGNTGASGQIGDAAS